MGDGSAKIALTTNSLQNRSMVVDFMDKYFLVLDSR